jgi:hypothetical protein
MIAYENIKGKGSDDVSLPEVLVMEARHKSCGHFIRVDNNSNKCSQIGYGANFA